MTADIGVVHPHLPKRNGALGVFADNRKRPIHRWYPFVEGYSAELIERALRCVDQAVPTIFDPFGGSGTTALAAAIRGFDSFFCEVNPYLAWVADVKTNRARAAAASHQLPRLIELADEVAAGRIEPATGEHPLITADAKRQYFPAGVAMTVVGIIDWISRNLSTPIAELALLACTTSLIPSSNMIRRTDLRRRTAGDPSPARLEEVVAAQLHVIWEDVSGFGGSIAGSSTKLASDVRSLGRSPRPFDLVITSPPYLNGTNYCRNTKLELLALGMLSGEEDLRQLRAESITAGINNVSSRRPGADIFPEVEEVATKLDDVAYDARIPKLVRLYFSDMRLAFRAIRKNAREGALFLLDVGDSRFARVHVRTHDLLVSVAGREGWSLKSSEKLRSRKSYDGTELTQVLLEFTAT